MSTPDPAIRISRRQMLAGLAGLAASPAIRCASAIGPQALPGPIGGFCDGCELIHHGMPAAMTPVARIAQGTEAGVPLVIRGTILLPDASTPAKGVILYAYHTDARGWYVPPDNRDRSLTRHGRLRGWIRTGADGRYRFDTIRPAAYPDREVPAHVHAIVKEPGRNEYYIDDYEFDDDVLLTPELRGARAQRGGAGVVRVARSRNGGLLIERDIVLGRNIPDYR